MTQAPDLLIDADVIVYMMAHKHQTRHAFRLRGDGPVVHTLTGNEDAALAGCVDFLRHLRERLGGGSIYVVLSDILGINFRLSIDPSYKISRDSTARPLLYYTLRDYLRDIDQHLECASCVHTPTGLEGDDVLGIWATAPGHEDRSIVCSIDKDMLTVPGRHYNWGKPERGVVTIFPAAAQRYHFTQTLTGDSTDGYPGCPGVGPVKAAKILNADPSWSSVVAAYEKAGKTEEDALRQARLAFILQHRYYNRDTGVKLWEPEI